MPKQDDTLRINATLRGNLKTAFETYARKTFATNSVLMRLALVEYLNKVGNAGLTEDDAIIEWGGRTSEVSSEDAEHGQLDGVGVA